MKKTKIILPIIMFSLIVMMAGLVEATTCATTCDNAVASVTENLVCNATVSGGAFNATNGTLYLYSSSTRNSSTATVANTDYGTGQWTNGTAGSDGNTYNISYLADGNIDSASDYTVYIKLVNTTGSDSLTCTSYGTSVAVDYGNPAISGCTLNTATASNTTVWQSTNSLACTIYNATSANIYWKDSTANSVTSGASDVGCSGFAAVTSYDSSGVVTTCSALQANDGWNTWYFDATDGTNTTTGTSYKLDLGGKSTDQIDEEEKVGEVRKILIDIERDRSKIIVGAILLLLVIVVALVYIALKKK